MNDKKIRCAIYTRKSTEEGLEQEFNSLQAQREACESYIKSQKHENWQLLPTEYDDGGYSGGNMERPALKRFLSDIKSGLVDIIVVYETPRAYARGFFLYEQFHCSPQIFFSLHIYIFSYLFFVYPYRGYKVSIRPNTVCSVIAFFKKRKLLLHISC